MRGFAIAAIVPALCACSTRLPPTGVEAFHRYDYRRAIAEFRSKAAEAGKTEDKDAVLFELGLLSSAMAAGDYWDAERASLAAQRVMWSDAGKGRGTASLVSAEALKLFKGEPFEKAMAAIYAGIIFYNRGDTDNARAAFGKALMAVRSKEEARENFALPYLLQAKVLLKLGDRDNARISIERARKAQPDNPYLSLDRLEKSNAMFFLELGQAPRKTRTGPGASLVEWQRVGYPERLAYVFVNDVEVGRSAEAGDLTLQARTKGWTGKDTVQAVKGATREAAAITTILAADQAAKGNQTAGWVALGAGLFTLLHQSQADVRQWEILPDRLHVVLASLPEGFHTIQLEFYDEGGRRLPSYRQVWYQVPMDKGDDRIFFFRSGPGKGFSTGG
jgi:tetratricopeptide (TPR) repeat protein